MKKEDSISLNYKKSKNKLLIHLGIILGLTLLLILVMIFSIMNGVADISISGTLDSIFNFNPKNRDHLVIMNLRFPRVIASMFIGTALAVSGALMQGVTRNPLADSGLMGLNGGSGFAIAICFAFFPGMSSLQIIIFSFLGAALGALIVYGIGAMVPGEITPIRLVLSGAAVSTLFTALSQGIAIYFKMTQNIMFWTLGNVAGVNWTQIKIICPIILAALIGAIIISRSVSLISLGEEVAKGLGVNTFIIKFAATVMVLLLAGTSVAVAGAIGFVGMIVPHLSRYIVGQNYRSIIPVSAVIGSLLMVVSDLLSRMIKPPFEIPIGAIISLIGVPIFLYLAKKQKGAL